MQLACNSYLFFKFCFVWMEGHPELKAQRKQQLLYRYGGAPHCFLERHASQECPACKHEEIKRTMRGTHDGMVKSCTTRAKQRCLPDRLRASVSQARRLLIEWGGVPSNTCRYCCYCQVRLLLLLLGGVVLCCAMLCYVLVIVMTIQFDSAQFNSTQLNSIKFNSLIIIDC